MLVIFVKREAHVLKKFTLTQKVILIFLIVIVIPLVIFFLFELYNLIILINKMKNKGQVSIEEEEEIKKRAIEEYLKQQESEKEE
mgnify:CR=1 FL=1